MPLPWWLLANPISFPRHHISFLGLKLCGKNVDSTSFAQWVYTTKHYVNYNVSCRPARRSHWSFSTFRSLTVAGTKDCLVLFLYALVPCIVSLRGVAQTPGKEDVCGPSVHFGLLWGLWYHKWPPHLLIEMLVLWSSPEDTDITRVGTPQMHKVLPKTTSNPQEYHKAYKTHGFNELSRLNVEMHIASLKLILNQVNPSIAICHFSTF